MTAPLPCPDCPEKFPDGFALIVHRRLHHPAKYAEWEAAERAKAKAAMDADAEARRQTTLPL